MSARSFGVRDGVCGVSEVRYLGTCRRCRGAGRPFVRRVDAVLADGKQWGFRVTVPGEPERRIHDPRWLSVQCAACVAAGVNASAACHYLQRVEGRESKHECGAKCLNATGPSCECRCRGLNHGAGHA